jgi:hypothetical protein
MSWGAGSWLGAWGASWGDNALAEEQPRNYRMTGGITSLSPRHKGGFKRPEAPPIIAPRTVEEDEALLLCCIA